MGGGGWGVGGLPTINKQEQCILGVGRKPYLKIVEFHRPLLADLAIGHNNPPTVD